MRKFKISAVSYLNTKPFLLGLEQSKVIEQTELSLDIPSVCAEKLISGEADIALAPVAVMKQLQHHIICSEYCIGAEGAVKTVCLYSMVPVQEVEQLMLDYQSRTSVELVKLLLQDFWKREVEFIPGKPGFEQMISGKKAALVIGDRTIFEDFKFNYKYDLGEAWFQHTRLPFVFAAWISNKNIPADYLEKFNAALQSGIQKIDETVAQYQPHYPGFDVNDYLTQNITFHLTSRHKLGMEKFLNSF